MTRPAADIKRDIDKATSQLRGALTDLARLSCELDTCADQAAMKPTVAHRARWLLSRS